MRVSNLDIRLTHWYLCFLAFAVCCFSLQWVGDGLIAGSSAYADAEVGACGATRNGGILMCFHPCKSTQSAVQTSQYCICNLFKTWLSLWL
ncbi:uncharacterized protein LOC132605935 isoform X2 [Lycium barbarum]|uniref:uncharacterized protein LOC132605935 isoform X2 n=1 Tax=Lycium barbarum TaxID=112863 RepID=UPI00293E24A6|nr:uncharacterized protein LOC132605935 isoform X2 [Lycium barbarum]